MFGQKANVSDRNLQVGQENGVICQATDFGTTPVAQWFQRFHRFQPLTAQWCGHGAKWARPSMTQGGSLHESSVVSAATDDPT